MMHIVLQTHLVIFYDCTNRVSFDILLVVLLSSQKIKEYHGVNMLNKASECVPVHC